MWLIHTTSLELEAFQGKPPPYAILSHRWGSDKEEVTFQQWRDDRHKISDRTGYVKILRACEKARAYALEYLWIDTACIDKSSSAELSEAINSMYAWYSQAQICYAYLRDVPPPAHRPAAAQEQARALAAPDSPFRRSAWFSRGWTLQELLAPQILVFCDASWEQLGTKRQLASLLGEITGIDSSYFTDLRSIRSASISCRLSWVSNRVTTRLEDIAYCMLGILDVHMTLIYGEGHRAFMRLQEEVMKASNEQSIFAWDWLPQKLDTSATDSPPCLRAAYLAELGWELRPAWSLVRPASGSTATTMLAPDPVFFYGAPTHRARNLHPAVRSHAPYSLTNMGLSITLPLYVPSTSLPDPWPGTSARPPASLALLSYCAEKERNWGLPTDNIKLRGEAWVDTVDTIDAYGFAVMWLGAELYKRDLDAPLLSIRFPRRVFSRYFHRAAVFVPGRPFYSIGTPEYPFKTGVWALESHHDSPELVFVQGISGFRGAGDASHPWKLDGSPSRRGNVAGSLMSLHDTWKQIVHTRAIYEAKWSGESLFVLVRAHSYIQWDLCEIEPSPASMDEPETKDTGDLKNRKWRFKHGGKATTLSQMGLETAISPTDSEADSSYLVWRVAGKVFEIRLEGYMAPVSSPESRIGFLYSLPVESSEDNVPKLRAPEGGEAVV